MKKSAAASPKRTVIVDAGPLKAAIDGGDADHSWAVRAFRAVPARYITFEAAIAEAQHGLENHPTAMRALRKLVARMDIVAVATALIQPVFNEVEQWAPRMDFADAGPLKAAIDGGDADHAWAVRVFRAVPARYITFEAAIAEAQHGLENHPTAMRALRKLVARMDIVAVATELIQPVFNEVEQWAPRMDFADACAVVLARSYERAFVLTTDFRDFSTYRVPFASPEGAFHV